MGTDVAALDNVANPAHWERLNYARILDGWPTRARRTS
jgi:hypothetical protein